MEDLWMSYTYIYIILIYLSIYIYMIIYSYWSQFHPFEPYRAAVQNPQPMQWSLRCPVLFLLRNLCASADGCWAECGRSGYYCPEFCCQPTDGGNPSCWDEAGIYTFSKCHWVTCDVIKTIATCKKIEKHSCHYFSGKLHFYLFGVTIKSYF